MVPKHGLVQDNTTEALATLRPAKLVHGCWAVACTTRGVEEAGGQGHGDARWVNFRWRGHARWVRMRWKPAATARVCSVAREDVVPVPCSTACCRGSCHAPTQLGFACPAEHHAKHEGLCPHVYRVLGWGRALQAPRLEPECSNSWPGQAQLLPPPGSANMTS
jgi:hypothetical protein